MEGGTRRLPCRAMNRLRHRDAQRLAPAPNRRIRGARMKTNLPGAAAAVEGCAALCSNDSRGRTVSVCARRRRR